MLKKVSFFLVPIFLVLAAQANATCKDYNGHPDLFKPGADLQIKGKIARLEFGNEMLVKSDYRSLCVVRVVVYFSDSNIGSCKYLEIKHINSAQAVANDTFTASCDLPVREFQATLRDALLTGATLTLNSSNAGGPRQQHRGILGTYAIEKD